MEIVVRFLLFVLFMSIGLFAASPSKFGNVTIKAKSVKVSEGSLLVDIRIINSSKNRIKNMNFELNFKCANGMVENKHFACYEEINPGSSFDFVRALEAECSLINPSIEMIELVIESFENIITEEMKQMEEHTKWMNEVKKEPKAVHSLILSHKVRLGFTKKQARLSWGEPEVINKNINESGTTEQWVYGIGR